MNEPDPAVPGPVEDDAIYDAFVEAAIAGDTPDPEEFCRARGRGSKELLERLRALEALIAPSEAGGGAPETALPGIAADSDVPFEALGEYRLLRRLGTGGMGVVYLAEQRSLSRLVALKIVRPEWVHSPTVLERFRREAEALARLRHPGIVTIHGVGEDRGVRYTVMELVPGRGLDELLAEAQDHGLPLDVRQVVGWVAGASEALEHAHRAGILHRDIKPSNLRITPAGEPVLVDFGLVRDLTSRRATLTDRFTGSPSYAAPERIAPGPARADPRSDVYSLGVTLYECLAGRVPFEGDSMEQLFRRVLADEPRSLRHWNPAVPLDLDLVVAKAIDKDPARRYASAGALARDLRNVLELRAVEARAPSAALRALRWCRRNRRLSAGLGSGAVLALVVVVAATLLSRSRSETLAKAERVRGLLAVIDAGLRGRDPYVSGALDPADSTALTEAERFIDAELADYPDLGAELHTTLADIHLARGDHEGALTLAQRAADEAAEAFGRDSRELLRACNVRAHVLIELARFAEAESLLRQTRAGWEARGEADGEEALSALHNLALSLKKQKRYAEGEELYRACLAAREARYGHDAPETVTTRAALARLLQDSGRGPAEAVALLREVVAADAARFGWDDPRTLGKRSMLGGALVRIGALDEAEETLVPALERLSATLGPAHSDTLGARRNLTAIHEARGDHAAARATLETLLVGARESFGDSDYRTLEVLQRLATACAQLEDWPAAAEAWEEARAVSDRVHPPGNASTIAALVNWARALQAAGDEERAREVFGEVLDVVGEHLEPSDPLRVQAESTAAAAGVTRYAASLAEPVGRTGG